ncbi:MAG: GtrA family protein [Acidocella sp.]|nr:GtrA family protein [Acidocella sp.]
MIEKTSSGWLGMQWNRLAAAAARLNISEDFIRFGVVGTMGFCWDTATVYALKGFINLYAAGAAGFFVAATANWAANRFWTFAHKDHGAMHVQWAKFLAANAVGFVFNRGSFFILITVSLLCRRQPVYAIITGSFAGLTFNYFLSKRYVFT